ncbi:type VII toxin-antitoxin system MntA family adenylyltransferase antitoxin [Natrialbaceae archaeon A-arb3/5]
MAADESLPLEPIREVLRGHPIEIGVLFGSHARGDSHSGSDIDIAVEFEDIDPTDSNYNEVLFGLGADLSEALETDEVDVIDLHRASPELVDSIFEQGILLVGDPEHATDVRNRLTTTPSDQSPRERFDAAIARIDSYLGSSGVTATDGETREQ